MTSANVHPVSAPVRATRTAATAADAIKATTDVQKAAVRIDHRTGVPASVPAPDSNAAGRAKADPEPTPATIETVAATTSTVATAATVTAGVAGSARATVHVIPSGDMTATEMASAAAANAAPIEDRGAIAAHVAAKETVDGALTVNVAGIAMRTVALAAAPIDPETMAPETMAATTVATAPGASIVGKEADRMGAAGTAAARPDRVTGPVDREVSASATAIAAPGTARPEATAGGRTIDSMTADPVQAALILVGRTARTEAKAAHRTALAPTASAMTDVRPAPGRIAHISAASGQAVPTAIGIAHLKADRPGGPVSAMTATPALVTMTDLARERPGLGRDTGVQRTTPARRSQSVPTAISAGRPKRARACLLDLVRRRSPARSRFSSS